MTLKEVKTMLTSVGVPFAYSHFSKTPNPPYLVYYYPSENDVFADGTNYVNKRQLFIELYTKGKDFDKESAVETVLKNAGLTWFKQTDFLNDENLFQTTYESEVIING